ncbi:putative adhesin [Streptomyces sp. IBSNAI002]|uniref:putative adhesin n=1 Tax=Streptomyces sp. IBSNAI002 TaxID=3457500 RepID=UPI003FCF3CB1
MKTIFVMAHGIDKNSQGVDVPDGWQVRLYVDENTYELRPNSVAVLNSGGSVGFRAAFGEGHQAKQVPNLTLQPHDHEAMITYLTGESSLSKSAEKFVVCGTKVDVPSPLRPVRTDNDLTLHDLMERLQGELFGPDDEDRDVVLHLLCCRPKLRQRAKDQIALGTEESRDYDERITNAFVIPEDDTRHFPSLKRKKDELIARSRTDLHGAMSELEGNSRPLKGAMRDMNMELRWPWHVAQADSWRREVDLQGEFRAASNFFPKAAVFGSLGDPPQSLGEAWAESPDTYAWRHAFHFYLSGPAQAGGEMLARLTLWNKIGQYMGATTAFLDESGHEHIGQKVLDTEVLESAAYGTAGANPGIADPGLLCMLETCIGQTSRLDMAARGDVQLGQFISSMTIDEAALLGLDHRQHECLTAGDKKSQEHALAAEHVRSGLADALAKAEYAKNDSIAKIGEHVYPGLEKYWQEFCAFLKTRWQEAAENKKVLQGKPGI